MSQVMILFTMKMLWISFGIVLYFLRHLLRFTMSGGGVRKITIFLKNETENLP
jgi:hypothetical protein